MKAAEKVVFNTVILYVQLILGAIVGLFTTRIVLGVLGENDYGVYMLVAGVAVMFSLLSSNMTNTSMRFMAYHLGLNDKELMFKTFNTTFLLHVLIGIVSVIILEIGGLFMFDHFLNIPEDKLYAAKIVYQFMIISMYVTIVAVPYDAVMNAHEDIFVLSVVDVCGYLLQLGAALYLTRGHGNLLILYGFLMFMIQLVLRIAKQWYCRRHYEECRLNLKKYTDKKLIKSILSFTSWDFLASLSAVATTQIRGIIINVFFGVKLNAAEGVANTACSKINLISANITKALNPQLMKSEGAGNRQRMQRITGTGSKFSVYLLTLFAVPIILEAPFLLNIWLESVPEYAIIFCRLLLVMMIVEKFTFQISNAIRAVGNIRNFMIIESLLRLMIIPLGYWVFKYGGMPDTIYIIQLVLIGGIFGVRLYFGRTIVGISPVYYMKKIVNPLVLAIVVATMITLFFYYSLAGGWLRCCLVFSVFMLILTLCFWFICADFEERNKLKSMFFVLLLKIKN